MNTSEIKQLAYSKGLDISEESIKVNESGVDFRVVHACDQSNDQWIVRIPRRPESMRHAQKEKKTLAVINHHATFQIPRWSVFSDELIAYRQLSGIPVATIDIVQQGYVWNLDETNIPDEYYRSLGKVLSNLHAMPQADFRHTSIEILTPAELRTNMRQRMERVKETYSVNPDLWNRWQDWLAKDSLWPSHVGVKHGDFHPGHILIDTNNYVTGIIDWTEAGIGDVSVDFMSHHLLFGIDGLTKLIDAYDNAGGKTWQGMAEHIIELLTTSGITVAEYAQASGLKEMHETAALMLAGDV